MIGYYWGVFLPAFEYHRFLKLGVGLGVFAAQFEVDYNLCSAYSVYYRDNDRYQTAECVGKKKIDSIDALGVGAAYVSNITIWERKTKDSIWRLFSLDGGSTYTTIDQDKKKEKETFGLKDRTAYFVPRLSIESGTLISYTYLF